MLKVKEKEIYEIAKKNDNLVDNCKMSKEAISKLKKENKKLETTAVEVFAKTGSSILTIISPTSLPSITTLPLNPTHSVSQSVTLEVSSNSSSNISPTSFTSQTPLVSFSFSLDSPNTSAATSRKKTSTGSSVASEEIPDPSLHLQESKKSSLPPETLNLFYSRAPWEPLQQAVKKLEESMNQMNEKI